MGKGVEGKPTHRHRTLGQRSVEEVFWDRREKDTEGERDIADTSCEKLKHRRHEPLGILALVDCIDNNYNRGAVIVCSEQRLANEVFSLVSGVLNAS